MKYMYFTYDSHIQRDILRPILSPRHRPLHLSPILGPEPPGTPLRPISGPAHRPLYQIGMYFMCDIHVLHI